MNKKVLTLCAGVLLSGMTAGTALAHTPEYRTPFVLSAMTSTPVNKIDTTKWYQLKTTLTIGDQKVDGLLVQTRDTQTGKVYLKVMNGINAPLLPSLWKIKYSAAGEGVSGGHWTFVNKETNLELSYDHTFSAKNGSSITKDNAVLEACNTTWEWQNTDVQGADFSEVAPYAYIDADSKKETVMCMIQRPDGLVYSYVGPKSEIIQNNEVNPSLNPLKIQPVLADAIRLNASDFNSMIDYNTASKAQNGEFKFFYPNGDAMDRTEMTGFANNNAMAADQKYHASFDDIHAIYDMALEQEGITEDISSKYEAVNSATEKYNQTKLEYAKAAANYQSILNQLMELELSIKGYEENIVTQEAILSGYSKQVTTATSEVLKQYSEEFLGVNGWYSTGRLVAKEGVDVEAMKADLDLIIKDYSDADLNSVEKVKLGVLVLETVAQLYAGYEISSVTHKVQWENFTLAFQKATLNEKDLNSVNELIVAIDNLTDILNVKKAAFTVVKADTASLKAKADTAADNYDMAVVELGQAKKDLAAAIRNQHAYDRTKYILEEGYMRLKLVEEAGVNVSAQNRYLMVDTAFHQGNVQNPLGADLKIANSSPKSTDAPAIAARYFFKLTYHPSQDSIVVEPLNASAISEAEYGSVSWKNSKAGNWFVWEDQSNYGSQPSNTFTRKKDGAVIEHPDGTEEVLPIVIKLNGDADTKGWALTTGSANKIDSELNTRIGFDNSYDYLKRFTPAEGLYFIKSKNTGKYVVANLAGNLQYDVPETGAQDYNNMPATMFVVERPGCQNGTRSLINNREYGNWTVNGNFEGQLYEDEDGIYIINKNYPNQHVSNYNLAYNDHYEFIPVEDKEALTSDKHGYQYLDPETLPYTEYAIHYNTAANKNLYLNVDADKYLKATDTESEEAASHFELSTVNPIDGKETVENYFGYKSLNLPQLKRQAYVLKYRDANLVDNDTAYVALVTDKGQNEYYKVMGINDIRAGKGQLAQFYLKADQVADTTYYALVDVRANTYWAEVNNGARIAKYTDANAFISHMDMDNQPTERISAFALKSLDRPLYRKVTDATINLFNSSNEKLVETFDKVQEVNFLGYSKDNNKNGALAVEEVVTDNELRMPQYLLGFDKNTVKDGYWCVNNTHGYFVDEQEAKDKDDNHYVFYKGYTEGRYLVSFVDSVMGNEGSHAYNKEKIARYTYKGKAVRLGFVEGIHMVINANEAKSISDFLNKEIAAGEYFFTLVGGHTLADLKNDQDKIIPERLFSAEYTKMNTYTTGKHNNWSFSFRLVDDNQDNFLVESNLPGVSSIGSMEGAWIKDISGCPVVSYIDGNHTTITASDLKKDNIRDGEVFTLEATDEEATANEEIAAGNVVVAGVNGAVVVKGAEGKNVIVSTILGKVVANEVVSSDNATIAAPQGVVVVSVDGESFKVVVK